MEIQFDSGVVAKVRIPANMNVIIPETNSKGTISVPSPIIVLAADYTRSRYNGDPYYDNTAVWSMSMVVKGVEVLAPVSWLEAVALELEFQKANAG